MLVFPNAKINLGLNILSKREDGYHNIESCLYPIPWRDALEAVPSKSFEFTQTGLSIDGDSSNNLCVKAYKFLKEDFDIPPVHMHLHKVIPMGAGLGGGSADGAFALKLLNDLFELGITILRLEEYAAKLGSDCPFFIQNKPALATGTGTTLKVIDLDLRQWHIGILYPNVHVSTKEAYAGVKPALPERSLEEILMKDPTSWNDGLKNDFEKSIIKNHRSIHQGLEKIKKDGASYAAMSGSGSAVFGLFKQPVPTEEYDFFSPLNI